MSPGCLLTLSPSGKILHRQPCWPWPSPSEYPIQLPNGKWKHFIPQSYLRFRIGYYINPFPPLSHAPLAQGSSMKTLLSNIPLDLHGVQVQADILLGLYTSSFRPAIILVDSRPEDFPGERAWASEPIAIASTFSPEEYLHHLPRRYFPAKTHAENKGLWDQLLTLSMPEGGALFLPTVHKITLSGISTPIMKLGPGAFHLYNEEVTSHLQEISHG